MTTGYAAITEYLAGAGVAYELVEHEPTLSAAAEARAAARPPDEVAKTVVLHDGAAYVLAVIPASERLDLHRLRELLGATRTMRLADEQEIAAAFPLVEVGAVPPFGQAATVEVIDRALLHKALILCSAGDHRHSLVVDPRELVRVTGARVADICQE